MRPILAAGVATLALTAGCATEAGDADTAAGTTATTESETTSTTVDPVVLWCAVDWAEVERQTDDPTIDSTEALDYMLTVAQAGAELDHPNIPAAAADIIDALTWPDRLAEDIDTPAPDPAAFSDAIITISWACSQAVEP